MLSLKIDRDRKVLFFLCVFSILYSLFFLKIYRYPVLGDEQTYYSYGVNLYSGNGYSRQESAPFLQSNFREPGYPLFIYLLFKVFGVSKSVIQIAQALLNGVIVAATFYLAAFIFDNKKIALAAASLTAVSPTIAGYASLISSETLAAVCLMLAILSFLGLLNEKKSLRGVGFSALTGFFCGYLALIKTTYFMFLPLICFALFIIPGVRPIRHKAVLCIVVVFTVTLLPWFSFNKRVYGNPFFLSNRGGIAATVKAERLDWRPKETAVSFIYPVSEGLIQKYFPEEYKKVTYNPVEGSAFRAAFDKYEALISKGYSEMDADKELRGGAFKRIKRNFLKYIMLSVSDFHYMLYFEGLPLSQFTEFFNRNTRMKINSFFKAYSLLIVFLAVKGIFIIMKNKEKRMTALLFLLPVIYTFLTYSAIFGAPRFAFTAIPLIYIFASAAIYAAVKRRVII